jgi:hypothetical protein
MALAVAASCGYEAGVALVAAETEATTIVSTPALSRLVVTRDMERLPPVVSAIR